MGGGGAQLLGLKGTIWRTIDFCIACQVSIGLNQLELSGYSWKPWLKFLGSTGINEKEINK